MCAGVKTPEQLLKADLSDSEWGSCPGKAAKKAFPKDAKASLMSKTCVNTPPSTGKVRGRLKMLVHCICRACVRSG